MGEDQIGAGYYCNYYLIHPNFALKFFHMNEMLLQCHERLTETSICSFNENKPGYLFTNKPFQLSKFKTANGKDPYHVSNKSNNSER